MTKGAEDHILDDRVRFYLRNRADIDEWAKLRSEAHVAFDTYFRGLEPDLESLFADTPADVRIAFHEGLPRFVCWLDHWPLTDSGHPVISVALEWPKGVIPDAPDAAPYVGVLVLMNEAPAEALRAAFRQGAVEIRDRDGWKHTKTWPVWQRVVAEGEYWDELDDYRSELLLAVQKTWDTFAGLIDQATAGVNQDGEPPDEMTTTAPNG